MFSKLSITPRGHKIIAFAFAKFLLDVGFVCGFFPSTALLIEKIGTNPLFYAYLGSSIFALCFSGTFYLLSQRKSIRALALIGFLLLGSFVVASWSSLSFIDLPPIGFIIIRSLFYGIFVLAEVLYWALAGDAFEVFDAKRYFPRFIAMGMMGFMCGSFINNSLAETLGAANLILIWAISLFVAPLLTILKSKRQIEMDQLEEPTMEMEDEITLPKNNEVPGSLALVGLIFVFWACYSFLCNGMDFIYNTKVLESLKHANEIAAYTGKIGFTAAICIILYQLFIVEPLTEKFGADRAVIILPCLIFLNLLIVLINPSLIVIAIAEVAIYYFIDYAGVSLFQPVLSTSASPFKARLLSEGLGRPFGIASLLLFAVSAPILAQFGHMRYVLFSIAVIFLSYPFIFRKFYIRYLIECLHTGDSRLLSNAIQALGEQNKKMAVKPLLTLLKETDKLDLKRTIILSLGHIRSGEAFNTIVSLFSVRNESVQNAVVEALSHYKNYESTFAIFRLMNSSQNVSFNVRMNAVMLLTRLLGKAMAPFLLLALDSEDQRIKANAIESLGLLKDRDTIPILIRYLDHPNHRIRANAVVSLYHFRRTRENIREKCELVIAQMFKSSVINEKSAAIYAIGKLKLVNYVQALSELLQDEDKKIRVLVCTSLALMERSVFAKVFIELLMDEDQNFAVDVAKRIAIFPRASRLMFFHEWSILPERLRWLIMQRCELTGLDFSEEKALATERKLLPALLTSGGP